MFVVDELGVKIGLEGAQRFESGLARIENAIVGARDRLIDAVYGVNQLLAPLERFKQTAMSAASSFESAFAEVKKTVDASDLPGGFDRIERSIRDMALQIPFAVEEISNVTAIGGQLGVPAASIEKFTKVILDMGVTTNMTTEEAATGMARLATIMKVPTEQFENLGSAINLLGSRGAATESEIVNMSLRMGALGTKVGFMPDQILALSEALSSVGVQAELGGGTMTRLFSIFDDVTKTGGAKLDMLNQIAGKDFKKAFQTNAQGALLDFVNGLNRLDAQGANTTAMLKTAGIKGVGFSQVLSGLQQASDKLAVSFDTGLEGWSRSNLLADEAAKRYETFAAQMQIMRNNVRDVAIEVGKALVPIMSQLNFQLMGFLDIWKALNPQQQLAVIYVGALATSLGSLLAVIGKINFALRVLGLSAMAPFLVWPAAIAAVVGGFAVLMGYLRSGLTFTEYWKQAQETLAGYAAFAKGFIMNFQENMGIAIDWLKLNWGIVWQAMLDNARMAWDWLGRNWGNLLRDIGNLALTYWGNMAKNYWVALETLIRLQVLFNGWLAGTMRSLWDKVFSADFLEMVVKGLGYVWTAFRGWMLKVNEAFFRMVDKMGVTLYEAAPILKDLLLSILTGNVSGAAAAMSKLGTKLGEQFADELNAVGDAVEKEGRMLADDARRGMEAGGSVTKLLEEGTDVVKEQISKLTPPLEGFKSSLEEMPPFKVPGLTTPKFNTGPSLTDTLAEDEGVTDPLVDGIAEAGKEAQKTGEKINEMLKPLRKEQVAIGWGSQEMWTAMFRQGLPAATPQATAGVDAAAAAMAEKRRMNLAKRGIIDPRTAPVSAPGVDSLLEEQIAMEDQFGPLQTGVLVDPMLPQMESAQTMSALAMDALEPEIALEKMGGEDDEMSTQTELLTQLVENTAPGAQEIVIDGPLGL